MIVTRRCNQASFLGLVGLLLGAGACGDKVTTFTCDPACPAGAHCEAGGCVFGGAAVDMVTPPPQADLAGCDPACSGDTPVCDDKGTCVACLKNADCPLGEQCGKVGTVPQRFVDWAEAGICHSDPERFALLYRLLWRLMKDKTLMEVFLLRVTWSKMPKE